MNFLTLEIIDKNPNFFNGFVIDGGHFFSYCKIISNANHKKLSEIYSDSKNLTFLL